MVKILTWIPDQIGATSSSFGANHLSKLWSKLWAARVPPKVKIYVWRIVHNILPTQLNLTRRHLEVEVDCVLVVPWANRPFRHLCVVGLTPGPLAQRIELVFDGVLGLSVAWLAEFLKCQSSDIPPASPVSSSLWWTLPLPRFIKVKVDGAWLEGLKLGGVGIIARNDNGEFFAARVLSRVTGVVPAHVHRQDKKMAHRLAKFALRQVGFRSWLEEALDFLADLFVLECNA
ncbi:hypothetical protein EV1_012981 [Malus domestica]